MCNLVEISFIHFQKIAKIYFEVGKDTCIKKPLVRNLLLSDICTKIFILKQILQNNASLDRACGKYNLVIKSNYFFPITK